MNRKQNLERIRSRKDPWDIAIIGGGATGAGCLLEAASRGLDAVLIEKNDFGSGTSSKSTKLVHGGVRYLEQRDVSLVREALRERGRLIENAPESVSKQEFVVPCFSLFEKIYYGTGLKLYDLLAGKLGIGKSRLKSKKQTLELVPTLRNSGITGSVSYFDGRFDDTELLARVLQTASRQNGCPVNYVEFESFKKNGGQITGIRTRCRLTDEEFEIEARVVINATGIFTDAIRRQSVESARRLVKWSQGIHVVLDREWLDSDVAVMIPKTSDGRILFAIPFYGKVLIGTTDTGLDEPSERPKPLEDEVSFVLDTYGNVFGKKPKHEDIRSVFAGIRPLVDDPDAENTAVLSRGHFIESDSNGLVTITGGKWTTFRNMAEEAVDTAIESGGLKANESVTEEMKLDSFEEFDERGLETELVENMPWTYADVIRAVRFEMAETVEDVLARRTRILFLDAQKSVEVSPMVAQLIASELGKDEKWISKQIEEFADIATDFMI